MQMQYSNLSYANLTGVNFNNCNLAFTDMTGADLTDATIMNTAVWAIVWSNTTCPDGSNSDDVGGTCENNL